MNVLTRGVRNAFRNQIRTFSIVVILGLSIGLSLTMLIAHQAVSQKIDSIKGAVGNTVTIQPAGFSGFSQVNNALSTSQLNEVKSAAHVIALAENLTDRLPTTGSSLPTFGGRDMSSNGSTTSLSSPVKLNLGGNGAPGGGRRFFVGGGGSLPGNFSPPVEFLGTTEPASVNGTGVTVSSGKTIDGNTDSNNALVSTDMASKNNLKVGSTFSAYNTTLIVAGIYKSGSQGVNNTVIVSLPAEQRLSGQSGDVTDAVATVDSLDNLNAAAAAIKNTLGSSADVTSSVEQADQTVQPLNNVKSISLYSLIGAVAAGSVIILLTMIMIVRERRREIGILKAIGASNAKVVFQFVSEAVTFTLCAAVIGMVLGVLAGNPITHFLVNSGTTSAGPGGGAGFGRMAGPVIRRGFGGGLRGTLSSIHTSIGWNIILSGLAAALVIAVAGSAVAAFFIAKVRPAEVMRTE